MLTRVEGTTALPLVCTCVCREWLLGWSVWRCFFQPTAYETVKQSFPPSNVSLCGCVRWIFRSSQIFPSSRIPEVRTESKGWFSHPFGTNQIDPGQWIQRTNDFHIHWVYTVCVYQRPIPVLRDQVLDGQCSPSSMPIGLIKKFGKRKVLSVLLGVLYRWAWNTCCTRLKSESKMHIYTKAIHQ